MFKLLELPAEVCINIPEKLHIMQAFHLLWDPEAHMHLPDLATIDRLERRALQSLIGCQSLL